MPEIDGFDTTIEIRKFNKNIPIIAFTAFDKSEIQEKVQISGISDVLNKPFTSSELIHIITKFTSSSSV
jgi:CheY-like chemotaxis protein